MKRYKLSKMSQIKSISKSTTKYLLLIVVIYASFHIALLSFRVSIHVVEGVSMEPNFYEGDLVVVRGVADKQVIQPSDVIVFHQPYNWDKLIIHRVVKIIISNTDGELKIPACCDAEFAIYSGIIGHLISYYIAKLRGCSIDKPRNLAKSVTVK